MKKVSSSLYECESVGRKMAASGGHIDLIFRLCLWLATEVSCGGLNSQEIQTKNRWVCEKAGTGVIGVVAHS